MATTDWWTQPAAVVLPTLPRFGEALEKAMVTWLIGETATWVEADVRAFAGSPFVAEFRVGTDGSEPVAPQARRLPSDGAVVQAMRALGPSGLVALAALLGDQEELIADIAPDGEQSPPIQKPSYTTEQLLAMYGRNVSKRPKERVVRQVVEARQCLEEGVPSGQIISRLTAQGIARRTAFNRLKEARRQMESGHGRS